MIFTARVRLVQDIADPRGRGTAVMTHHAELPTVLAAEQWASEVADNAQNGEMGRRWLADRSGAALHRVEVFRRSIEDRSSFERVAEVPFSLSGLLSGPSLEIPGSLGQVSTSGEHFAPDPTASVLVVEDGFSGGQLVTRRCYVGPAAPHYFVGMWELPIVGPAQYGYLLLPGSDADLPADQLNGQGWWGDQILGAAARYVRGMSERAEDLGGHGAIISWKSGTVSWATRWRPAAVRAHSRSRGTGTTFGPAEVL